MSQALPFVCGPASLIQALNWRGSSISNDLGNQIRIWRAANTIFMGQGAAGCDSTGLARAAEQYGAFMSVVRLHKDFSFSRTVASPVAKEVVRLVENENRDYLRSAGRFHHAATASEAIEKIDASQPMLILCSMRAFSHSNEYHWLCARRHRSGTEIYDPFATQYEIALDRRFFEDLRSMPLEDFLSRHWRHVIDLVC
jgi:hypothetical protein